MTKFYELRIGNGNEGNYFDSFIAMEDGDCPFSFMRVVIANRFIVGKPQRYHAYKNAEVDGESEYTIYATLYEGYRGENNFGAAYITASLEADATPYKDPFSIKEYLDKGAYRKYLQLKRK